MVHPPCRSNRQIDSDTDSAFGDGKNPSIYSDAECRYGASQHKQFEDVRSDSKTKVDTDSGKSAFNSAKSRFEQQGSQENQRRTPPFSSNPTTPGKVKVASVGATRKPLNSEAILVPKQLVKDFGMNLNETPIRGGERVVHAVAKFGKSPKVQYADINHNHDAPSNQTKSCEASNEQDAKKGREGRFDGEPVQKRIAALSGNNGRIKSELVSETSKSANASESVTLAAKRLENAQIHPSVTDLTIKKRSDGVAGLQADVLDSGRSPELHGVGPTTAGHQAPQDSPNGPRSLSTDDDLISRKVSSIRDVFAEKRGGEGGLAAALKVSRNTHSELVARVEEMRRKVRRLDESQKGRLNARSRSPEIEQELSDLSKVIAASVEKCSEDVQRFGIQQDEAEKCLNRANSAILSRMNHADNASQNSAGNTVAVNRALIRDERSRVTAFLSTIDGVKSRQSDYETELDQLLELKLALYQQIGLQSSFGGEHKRSDGNESPSHLSRSFQNDEIVSGEEVLPKPERLIAPDNEEPTNKDPNYESSEEDVNSSCFTPMKRKQIPKSSFSHRKLPQQDFAFDDPDVVFDSKVGNAEIKPAPSNVIATLFFSPFTKRSASHSMKKGSPAKGTSSQPAIDSPSISRPESLNEPPQADQRASQSSRGFLHRAAQKFSKALTTCEKQVASKWSKLIAEPPLVSAAIQDQVEKLQLVHEAEGLDALCHVAEASGWTIAHYAAHHSSMKSLEFLCTTAPRLFSVRDRKGNTPSHIAAARNHKQVLRLLHRHSRASFGLQNLAGKLPNDCGNKESRALMEALESNHGGPITADVLATGRTFLRKTGISLT